jgi:hypothetical protein
VVERLLSVQRTTLVPYSVDVAAEGVVGGRRLITLEDDMKALQKSMAQVQDIRERLADVPALPQKGTLL